MGLLMADQGLAYHEVSHGTTSFLLGACRRAGPMTIVPAPSAYSGLCVFGRAANPPAADLAKLGLPYVLVPARVRRRYESEVMSLLGGQIGADLHMARGDVQPLPEPEETSRGREEPVVLPEREERLLERAAAGDPQSDLDKAMKVLLALHYDDMTLAGKHLAFLAHETEVLLSGQRARRMVRTLSAELLARGTLSARAWKAILRDAA
jgi:hypothetical protein